MGRQTGKSISWTDGLWSDKWWSALATSLFLHALVLTAASAFIAGEQIPPHKTKVPFLMEVTLQHVAEPLRQGDRPIALAGGGASLVTGGHIIDEAKITRPTTSFATTPATAQYRESARQGSGGTSGSGVSAGLGNGVGPGSGPGSAAGSKGGSGITRGPVVLSGTKPDYPDVARSKGWKGTVKLRIFVSRSGEVKDTQIVGSSGFTELDDTARQAVQNWRFRPALENGAAVSAWVTMPIVFDLR